MKIAVFYAHVLDAAKQTGSSVAEILKQVKGFGFSGLECDYREICEDPAAFLAQIKAAGLEVSSVYRFFDFGHSIDARELEEFVALCGFLETQRILAIPGFFREDSHREEELAGMVEGTAQLCALAAQKGITVTLEDFDSDCAPFNTDDELVYFMEQIPALGYTYDTGNFYYCGVDLLTAFDKLRHRIVHVHCKNRALAPLYGGGEEKAALNGRLMYPAPVGEGDVPMEAALDKVLGIGYDGYFTCEHFGANDQLLYMEKSARWLKDKLFGDGR